ncbi:MAG: peptidoglycan DD-metalloendopeptidase family protein [Acidimicrobiales bacterium]
MSEGDGATRVLSRLRRSAPLALLGLLAAAAPPAHAQQPPTEELEQARHQLEAANAEEALLLTDYQVTAARLVELGTEGRRLDQSVAAAEAATSNAQLSLDVLTAQVAEARVRLAEITRRLEDARIRLRAEAVEAYMHGGTPLRAVAGALDHASLGDFQSSLTYASIVLGDHQATIDEFRALEEDADRTAAQLAESEAAAATTRDELAAQQAKLGSDRAAVAALEGETQTVAAHQRDLVAQAETKRATFEQLVAHLEAESARIAEELRQRQAAEEARQRRSTNPDPSPGERPSGQLADPLDRMVITSGFGWRIHPIYGTRRFHAGIDLDGETGDAVYAAEAGVVVRVASDAGGYGQHIAIDHGGGMATVYAHLSAMSVSVGETVSRRELIGRVGSTGASTGPHLHFEVRINGEPVDPVPYLV